MIGDIVVLPEVERRVVCCMGLWIRIENGSFLWPCFGLILECASNRRERESLQFFHAFATLFGAVRLILHTCFDKNNAFLSASLPSYLYRSCRFAWKTRSKRTDKNAYTCQVGILRDISVSWRLQRGPRERRSPASRSSLTIRAMHSHVGLNILPHASPRHRQLQMSTGKALSTWLDL